MDTDKAYLLGLIIGGGVFGNAEDVFRIRLPYKKWGSYIDNPQRAGQIAGDILRKVGRWRIVRFGAVFWGCSVSSGCDSGDDRIGGGCAVNTHRIGQQADGTTCDTVHGIDRFFNTGDACRTAHARDIVLFHG